MGFESLLGNQRLKDNLTAGLKQGRTSHFYLISGPEGSGKKTLAALLAAAMMCDSADKPCLRCSSCRKVLEKVHPDVISVEDPEHKNVAVRIVRQMRDDVFIRPNEGRHKVYIFPQEMGIEGQNALLKVLEEPPHYGVFLLLTDNPEKILPTVRSRCVELQLQPLASAELEEALAREFPQEDGETIRAAAFRSGGFLGQARRLLTQSEQEPQVQEFVDAVAGRDALQLTRLLVPMGKWKRDKFLEMLQQWLELTEAALAARSGMPPVSRQAAKLASARSTLELHNAAAQLQKAILYAQGNVSVAAICGHLQWALR